MPKRDFSHSVSSKIRDLQERREHLEAAAPDRAMDLAVSFCLHLSELISLADYSLIRGGGVKWLVAGLSRVSSLPAILVTVFLARKPRTVRFDCRGFPQAHLLGHLRQRIDDGAFGHIVSATLRHGG